MEKTITPRANTANEAALPTRPTNPQACTDMQGTLPSCAPLANPYVPYQSNGAKQYQPAKGFIRGTLFPGLDLPFMGMVNNTEKTANLLNQLQALSFAMTELGLYLDTHKTDTEAMELFTAYEELYGELSAEYEDKFGPLTQRQSGHNGQWTWTNQPWPWEEAANREG